jgi:hypothetical protein
MMVPRTTCSRRRDSRLPTLLRGSACARKTGHILQSPGSSRPCPRHVHHNGQVDGTTAWPTTCAAARRVGRRGAADAEEGVYECPPRDVGSTPAAPCTSRVDVKRSLQSCYSMSGHRLHLAERLQARLQGTARRWTAWREEIHALTHQSAESTGTWPLRAPSESRQVAPPQLSSCRLLKVHQENPQKPREGAHG